MGPSTTDRTRRLRREKARGSCSPAGRRTAQTKRQPPSEEGPYASLRRSYGRQKNKQMALFFFSRSVTPLLARQSNEGLSPIGELSAGIEGERYRVVD